MDFFDKLGKKASETYQATKEKTAKMTAELKLKSQINEAEDQTRELYVELGKKVYIAKSEGNILLEEDVQESCDKIAEQKNKIRKAQDEIKKLRNIKTCISCSAEIEYGAAFCSKCGKEQPKESNVEVTSEVEGEKKEAEVVEVKNEEVNSESNTESETPSENHL